MCQFLKLWQLTDFNIRLPVTSTDNTLQSLKIKFPPALLKIKLPSFSLEIIKFRPD